MELAPLHCKGRGLYLQKWKARCFRGWDFLGIFKLILCEGMVEWLVCLTNLEIGFKSMFFIEAISSFDMIFSL